MVKNLPANAGDTGDSSSSPGSERSPGRGNGNPFQYSCLGNPLFRRAWCTAVHGVTESRTRLTMHAWWNTRGITFSERNDLCFFPQFPDYLPCSVMLQPAPQDVGKVGSRMNPRDSLIPSKDFLK